MSKVTNLLIDGDIFVADGGTIVRFVGGKSEGWGIQAPGTTGFAQQGDILLRSAPNYTLIASASDKRTGLLYAWDQANGRVVAFDKAKGTFVEQYRLAGGSSAFNDVRGMFGVMSAILEAVPDLPSGPAASGLPGPGASNRASPGASVGASRSP